VHKIPKYQHHLLAQTGIDTLGHGDLPPTVEATNEIYEIYEKQLNKAQNFLLFYS